MATECIERRLEAEGVTGLAERLLEGNHARQTRNFPAHGRVTRGRFGGVASKDVLGKRGDVAGSMAECRIEGHKRVVTECERDQPFIILALYRHIVWAASIPREIVSIALTAISRVRHA